MGVCVNSVVPISYWGPENFKDKILVYPSVSSASFADRVAVDKLIATLGLVRVGVFSSDFVCAMVQRVGDKVVTAMELYGNESSRIMTIQVRSNVSSVKKLATQISQFAAEFAHCLVIGCGSGHLLSGSALESPCRVSEGRNTLSGSGMLKHITHHKTIVGISMGTSYDEVEQLATELEKRVISTLEGAYS